MTGPLGPVNLCPLRGDGRVGWRVAPQDSPDDFVHLCTPCKEHLAGQPGAMNLSFELLEHAVPGWEVAEDA